jgi:bifunctional UDP-N-acetylglucosamine 2-epimerase / N-acetylmannosamine kinase
MSESNYLSHLYRPEEMAEKHLCLCIFNRATYARSKVLIDEIAKYPWMKLTVALSSALLWKEYGSAGEEYIRDGHKNVTFELIEVPQNEPTHLGICLGSSDLLAAFARYFASKSFHGVIVVADRYETLPCAMAAAYQNIPLIHIQGGEITGNIDDKVRHAITQLADWHFVSTDVAKDYLIAMGVESFRVYNTGCPSLDLINRNTIIRSVGKEKYILSIFHPETENTDHAFEQTEIVLKATLEYCAKYGARCYWFYPNPDPGREEITRLLDRALSENPEFLVKAINKEPEVFLRQLAGARFIVGNSSCGIREASFLGVPALNVGARQRMRERGINVYDLPYDSTLIFSAMEKAHEMRRYIKSYLYGDGRASKFIATYLTRIDYSLRGPLTYPFNYNFKSRHFGENRFKSHARKREEPFKGKKYDAKKRMANQGT